MSMHKLRGCVLTRMLGAIAAIAFLGIPLASAENSSPAWPDVVAARRDESSAAWLGGETQRSDDRRGCDGRQARACRDG